METNFDYLLKKEEYVDFAKQAVEAEKSLSISPATCAILSRRALELAGWFGFLSHVQTLHMLWIRVQD